MKFIAGLRVWVNGAMGKTPQVFPRIRGMVQNACHSGDSSGPLDGSGVLQRLLPAAERRNFIAWRREPQGRCRRERTTNPLDPNPKRGRQLNASRTWGRL